MVDTLSSVPLPATQDSDDHFSKFQQWSCVHVNPTVKRLGELFSRFTTRTCFCLAPGTYYGPLVVRGNVSCLIRVEGDGEVVIESESDHYPALTLDGTGAVQLNGINLVAKGYAPALQLKSGSLQAVDCQFRSHRGGETVSAGSNICLKRCAVGARPSSSSPQPSSHVGLALCTANPTIAAVVLNSTFDSCGTGIVVDGPTKYRMEHTSVTACVGCGFVAGGSSNGILRHCSLNANGQHGMVSEADSRVFAYQSNFKENVLSGILLCDASHSSVFESVIEHNHGSRQIDIYGSVSTTLKENKVTCDGGAKFAIGVAFSDVSDGVLDGNTFLVPLPKDQDPTSSPAAAAAAAAEGHKGDSSEIDDDDGDESTALREYESGTAAILADGSSTPTIKGNTIELSGAARQRVSTDPTVRSCYGIMLGLWHGSKIESNSFDGFQSDRTVYSIDSAGALDRHGAVSWRTKTKRREQSRPTSANVTRGGTSGSASTPLGDGAAGGSVVTRFSSMWREQHGTPDNAGPTPRKPSSRPSSAKGPRGGSRGQQQQQLQQQGSGTIPVLKDDLGADGEGESAEVRELRLEVERLKARLRMRPQSASSSGRPSTAGSSRGGRPSSARSRPESSLNGRSTSSIGGHNLKVVGRYTWDMDKMEAFNKLQVPLSEVRIETEPIEVPGDVPSRLHDKWLEDRKQRSRETEVKEQLKKGWEPKLDQHQQRAQASRMHDAAVQRFQQNAEELRARYLPVQPRTRLTPSQHREFNDRIFTKHEEYKKRLAAQLWKKHVLANDHRKHLQLSRTSVETYCSSLHKSHRDKQLVEAASKATGTAFDVIVDRPIPGVSKRIPRPPKPRSEVETYCASLYRSHQDPGYAAAADAVTHSDIASRVSARRHYREARSASPR